jgi:hypothetical protein
MKDVVRHKKPQTLETLREEIEMSCAAFPVEALTTVARAPVHRTHQYLQADSGHSEHLL